MARSIVEVLEVFKIAYDQYNRQEGLLDEEICRHLNTALTQIMTDHFRNNKKVRRPNQDPPYGYESDQYSNTDFSPLIKEVEITPDSTGKLLLDDVRAELDLLYIRREEGLIEERRAEIFHYDHVLRYNTADDEYIECRWQAGNVHGRDARNPYRKPTEKYPKYREIDNYIQFYPEADNSVKLFVVQEHPFMWYSETDLTTQVDFQLNNRVMTGMVTRALSLAGLSVRDLELYQGSVNESNVS